ncbi:probable Kelch-like protein 6 at N-terminal half [Coccomyxa sp. Obi]|nr:probable Kelch-like protein 6 at N-terminal half [Coccomyxa sp. Obi]
MEQCFPPARVLHLLAIAQQTRTLLEAVGIFATSSMLAIVPAVVAEDSSKSCTQTPIPFRESLVCELTLQVAEKIQVTDRYTEPTVYARGVIGALQDCIFGSNLQNAPFLQLVCCQSYEKACLAREACIGLLERSVTPANCFPLLNLASRCKLPSLTAAAHAVAVAQFSEACELDGRGYHALPAEVLSEVLGCDSLVVDNELQVFTALIEWVTVDKLARLPLFHTLLVKCVRLGCMSRSELYELDIHPMTPSCPEVMKAVAFAYLELCYGGPSRCMAARRHSKRACMQPASQSMSAVASGSEASCAPDGAPVHRHLPPWGCQSRAPECMPMDCCTTPPSPTARTGPPLETDRRNVSGASSSPPSATCGEPSASQHISSHWEACLPAPYLLQSCEPGAAAAFSAQMASADASGSGLGSSPAGRIASGCGSQKNVSARLGTEGVFAEPLQAHAAQYGIEASSMMMSPPKRKAPAAPREESEAEAMQLDKMPRLDSCRRLRFF